VQGREVLRMANLFHDFRFGARALRAKDDAQRFNYFNTL